MHKAKILRIHFSAHHRYNDKPLYEAIVQKCRDMNIAGATVFRGLEGYGESAEIHKHHLNAHDEPIIMVIVDDGDRIRELVPMIEQMMDTGMLATSDVEMMRVQNDVPTNSGG